MNIAFVNCLNRPKKERREIWRQGYICCEGSVWHA